MKREDFDGLTDLNCGYLQVPLGLIKAKVTHVLFPFDRFGPVEKRSISNRVTVGFIQPGHDDDYW